MDCISLRHSQGFISVITDFPAILLFTNGYSVPSQARPSEPPTNMKLIISRQQLLKRPSVQFSKLRCIFVSANSKRKIGKLGASNELKDSSSNHHSQKIYYAIFDSLPSLSMTGPYSFGIFSLLPRNLEILFVSLTASYLFLFAVIGGIKSSFTLQSNYCQVKSL